MLKLIYFSILVLIGSMMSVGYSAADHTTAEITPHTSIPALEFVTPSNAVIPANTLRFYLTFSNSMERGQVTQNIWVEDHFGTTIENPFLKLGVELWDPQQKRVTLLIDPGRIKTGVGPNELVGAVFKENYRYAIVVSGAMQDVDGVPIGIEQRIEFTAGPAIVDPVNLSLWKVDLPPAGTRFPFIVRFDRIMDVGTSTRMIAIHGTDGKALKGKVVSHGTYLEFFPLLDWVEGVHHLKVDMEIEDVSGNSIVVPFEKNGDDVYINVLSELTFQIIDRDDRIRSPIY